MSGPTIISAAELLRRINGDSAEPISRTTLYRWLMNDPRWRCCIVETPGKKLWLSVQRLIDTGILPRPDVTRMVAMPALSFSFDAVGVGS